MLATLQASRPNDEDVGRADPRELLDRFEKLEETKACIELALALAITGPHPDAAPSFLARADPYMALAKNYPARARAKLDDLQFQIDDLRPRIDFARQQDLLQRREKALAAAVALAPKHRAAVKQIAAAIEILSKAVEAEREIHRELLATIDDSAAGHHLHDMTGFWRHALLSDPNSVASRWRMTAEAAGFL